MARGGVKDRDKVITFLTSRVAESEGNSVTQHVFTEYHLGFYFHENVQSQDPDRMVLEQIISGNIHWVNK